MSYIVRMLVEVIWDMIPFGVVLLIAIIAMADAFLSIKEMTKLDAKENNLPVPEDECLNQENTSWTEKKLCHYIKSL